MHRWSTEGHDMKDNTPRHFLNRVILAKNRDFGGDHQHLCDYNYGDTRQYRLSPKKLHWANLVLLHEESNKFLVIKSRYDELFEKGDYVILPDIERLRCTVGGCLCFKNTTRYSSRQFIEITDDIEFKNI